MIKAIIVDDEAGARRVLQDTLAGIEPKVTVCGSASNVDEALILLSQHHPDIIFLDIELSYQTGFDLLDNIEANKYKIIFTTAYNQYAIKAIRYAAFDYLLKPISPSELKNCLERFSSTASTQNSNIGVLKEYFAGSPLQRLLVPTEKGIEILDKAKIIRLEGDRNYTIIHCEDEKPLLTSKTLKEYEEQLEGGDFFRIYQSHLVNLNYVVRYLRGRGGKIELKDGTQLSVSRDKKQTLLELLAGK